MLALMAILLAFFTYGMVFVLWGVGAILENGYRIQEQNYVTLLQGSEMSAGFHHTFSVTPRTNPSTK